MKIHKFARRIQFNLIFTNSLHDHLFAMVCKQTNKPSIKSKRIEDKSK